MNNISTTVKMSIVFIIVILAIIFGAHTHISKMQNAIDERDSTISQVIEELDEAKKPSETDKLVTSIEYATSDVNDTREWRDQANKDYNAQYWRLQCLKVKFELQMNLIEDTVECPMYYMSSPGGYWNDEVLPILEQYSTHNINQTKIALGL